VEARSVAIQFIVNRPADGGQVASLTHWPPGLYPQEDSMRPGAHLCYIMSRLQGHTAVGNKSIRSIDKSSDLIGSRSRDLSTCSIVIYVYKRNIRQEDCFASLHF
jgi:hypothetical protein